MRERLRQLYPPYLTLMIVYVLIVSLFINYELFDSREFVIYLAWIPILMLPALLFKNQIFYKIAVIIFFLDGFINLCHLVILKGPVTASSLFIALNTNYNEAFEFLNLKFSALLLLVIPYILLFVMALRKRYVIQDKYKGKYIILLVLLFATAFLIENLWNDRLVRKGIPQTAKAGIALNAELKSFNALKKRKLITVDASFLKEEKHPQIFVLIMGESCSRNHMSLYGYERETNPLLTKRDDLVVFNDVVSPYSNTLNSVLSMLTQANLENGMGFDKSISLIDIFHSLHFKTFWLSNQSPIGVWDNAIFNLAQISHTSVFVNSGGNTSFESTYVSSYDERLFKPFRIALEDESQNKFIVLHLMGSHSTYAKRYPQAFNQFSDRSSKRERIINEYDNSILYNDFVVDSLLNILEDYSNKRKLISSAIYLSDHGENVYDENDNAGHDYAGSIPRSNVEIPFMVWFSDQYKQSQNEKINAAIVNANKPFLADDLFHAVLDLNDINTDVFETGRSIFNESYNSQRKRILEDNEDYDLK